MHRQDNLLRGFGLREIATGIGILTASNPRPWLWGRVAGDVLDVATVAVAADSRKPGRLGSSFAALLGVGLLGSLLRHPICPATESRARRESSHDYSKRSGFPRGIEQMRGAAVKSGAVQSGAKSSAASKLAAYFCFETSPVRWELHRDHLRCRGYR